MSCFLTGLGSRLEAPDGGSWHVHEADELCLITGTATTIIHGGVETRAEPGTLYLFRSGERHGFRNAARQEPHLWVVHYASDPELYREQPALIDRDPARRIWRLDAERQEAFKALFLRLLSEQRVGRPLASAASAAWLRLMLVTAARWQDAGLPSGPSVPTADAALQELWEVINDHVGRPADLAAAIARRIPNYDSLRHRFRKVFKASPREVLIGLRMEHAKTMLLETTLAIGEVARRLGYARQHEFARAFHREVGCTPTSWREHAGGHGRPRI